MGSRVNETLGKTLLDNNISAKKRFGQNFLHDKNIIKQIVKASNSKNKNILEVGPGPGLMTKILLDEKPKNVLAIETDESFLPILNKIKEDHPLKFNFIIFINKFFCHCFCILSNLNHVSHEIVS